MDGKNETRLLRIWFQLLPEMDNVRIYRPCVWIVLVTPDRVQKPITGERFRRMGDEVCQQRELFCGKIQEVAGPAHFIAADVDFDIAEPVDLGRGQW